MPVISTEATAMSENENFLIYFWKEWLSPWSSVLSLDRFKNWVFNNQTVFSDKKFIERFKRLDNPNQHECE